MQAVLALLLGIQDGGPGVPPPEPSAAIVEAKANRARMRGAPQYKQEPDTVVPPDAQERGEHGEAIVSAIVGVDGRMIEPTIKVSTRSAAIDKAALAAASEALFEPARDAAGGPIAVYISVSFKFDNAASFDRKAIFNYRCAQFIKDQAWWRMAWPEKPRDNFGNLLAGMTIVRFGTRPEDLKRGAAQFDEAWRVTQE
ncbi:MAG: hypothetical protein B7Z43_04825, partial [Sphingomonas sp. 12-62-6]